MLNQSFKKQLTFAYIFLLIFSVVFVKYALKQDYVAVNEKDSTKKDTTETRNVDVSLEVFEDLDSSVPTSSYRVKMSNLNTVGDLIHKLRSDELISYEITSYIDGFELNHVNRIFPNPGEKWAVFYNGEDITSKIDSIDLKNDEIYSLRLIRTEEPQ
jgi:hypothetical protein